VSIVKKETPTLPAFCFLKCEWMQHASLHWISVHAHKLHFWAEVFMCRVIPQEQGITEIRTPEAGAKGSLISVMPELHACALHKAQPDFFI
jgi:hypothetical protein